MKVRDVLVFTFAGTWACGAATGVGILDEIGSDGGGEDRTPDSGGTDVTVESSGNTSPADSPSGSEEDEADAIDAMPDSPSDVGVADVFSCPEEDDSGTQSGSCTCQFVLLIGSVSAPALGLLTSIQSSSSAFCRVDYLDANGGTTPTAAYLSPYAVVLAYNDNDFPYDDPAGLGNSLAAYFDGGGRVVIALFADAGYPIGGAFVSDNYLFLTPLDVPSSGDSFSSSDPAQDIVPTSPILTQVASISGAGWHGPQALQNGGVAVARWASGDPLAVVGTVTDANGHVRNVVDLNILPTDIAAGAWTGNGVQLIRNALLYQ